ncbi:MAG: UDP-N-acetylmuramoyl-L-alanine--D-glutamate ligase [Anaerolineales bacterium]|nr:UDP-N-acetylmuramoyl-L-alanine--D-glutamate ligase [Chloroflexota bacterium]MBL6980563.1 UDP-N-acetylmuramoyl-L-alanine--D-glutamate ligase [Anaerolineales bacterium]
MKNIDWKDQRILIIGAARQGTALARYLIAHGAHVILNDHRNPDDLAVIRQSLKDLPIEWVLGSHPLELLDHVDLVCVSGGIPLNLPIIVEAQNRDMPLSNDSQIFLDAVPCKVIGITGSAGKTTTTSLVGRITEESVNVQPSSINRIWVGGNIGNPLITNVDEIVQDDLVVMELSSFQLDLMTCSPDVAAVLNVTPNHLDRHGTMEAYTAAKKRILDFQNPGDTAILGHDDLGSLGFADFVRGDLYTFGMARPPKGRFGTFLQDGWITLWDRDSSQKLLPIESIQLRGAHNLLNVLAACAIASAVEIPAGVIQAGVEKFKGVAHRLEYVRSWGGADWYNDSMATAPERAIAAINAFDEPIVLLVGGRDKNLPWAELAAVAGQRVDHLVIFGEASDVISHAMNEANHVERPYTTAICQGLCEAVKVAAEVVDPGDVVLLAPGGTSFDEFIDFSERGEYFRKWVNELV